MTFLIYLYNGRMNSSMKYFYLLILLNLNYTSDAQDLYKNLISDGVNIEFSPGSNNHFELFIKNSLDYLGIKSKIFYTSEYEPKFDYTLTYGDALFENGNLKFLYIHLKKNDSIVSRAEYSGPILAGANHVKIAYKLMRELISVKFNYDKADTKIPRSLYNSLTYSFVKVDSVTYEINIRGTGSTELDKVRKEFHKKAVELSNGQGYKFYYQVDNYEYLAPSTFGNTMHSAPQLTGILITNSEKIDSLEYRPFEFQFMNK